MVLSSTQLKPWVQARDRYGNAIEEPSATLDPQWLHATLTSVSEPNTSYAKSFSVIREGVRPRDPSYFELT